MKLTKDDIKTFERFVSSIIRDKKNTRVLIMGNLLGKSAGILQGDPLLEYYGINPEADFKYIDNTSTDMYKGANLLYYNSKDEFKGIEDQEVFAGVDIEANKRMAKNEMPAPGEKIVGIYSFLSALPMFGLLFTYNTQQFSLNVSLGTAKVKKGRKIEKEEWPIVQCSIFEPSTQPSCPIYTNEAALYNSYKSCCRYVEKEVWVIYVRKLVRMFRKGRVLLADNITE